MKILAIIVIYKPNEVDVINNILQFINEVDNLIIWKNSPSTEIQNYFETKTKFKNKIITLGNEINRGIAFPLNKAYEIFMNPSNEYSHLLTMDQDSKWINFKDYKRKISNSSCNAIYTPIVNNKVSIDKDFLNIHSCITSGTIFTYEALKKIGKFNEQYSVDCVDYDFSFRANRKGVKIYKVNGSFMDQIFGIPISSKFLNFKSYEYSAKRLFFITRNHIMIWRDYPDQINETMKKRILKDHIFGKLIKVLLIEDMKLKKIFFIIRGIISGILNDRSKNY